MIESYKALSKKALEEAGSSAKFEISTSYRVTFMNIEIRITKFPVP
jgi:hypothetical protein